MQHLNYNQPQSDMYTEPIIFNPKKPKRSYIKFYLNDNRQRVYSGRALGLPIFPNKAKTPKERLSSLQLLKKELVKALATDTYPYHPPKSKDADLNLIQSEIHRLKAEWKRANELNEQLFERLENMQKMLVDYLDSNKAEPKWIIGRKSKLRF